MFRLLLLITVSLAFVSCGIVVENSCGPDIELGSYDLKEETFDYFAYDANDKLVFEDQDGNQITFTCTQKQDLISSKRILDMVCNESFFDTQVEYLATQTQYIIFKSDNHENDYLRIDLITTSTNEDDLHDKVIYDALRFKCSINAPSEMYVCNFSTPTAFHQKESHLEDENYNLKYTREIKDTIIDDKQYVDVIIQKNWDDKLMLYSKEDGLVLIKQDSMNYIRLKNKY